MATVSTMATPERCFVLLLCLLCLYIQECHGGCGSGCKSDIEKGPQCGKKSEGIKCMKGCDGLKSKAKLLKVIESAACSKQMDGVLRSQSKCWYVYVDKCQDLAKRHENQDKNQCIAEKSKIPATTCISAITKEAPDCLSNSELRLNDLNQEVILKSCEKDDSSEDDDHHHVETTSVKSATKAPTAKPKGNGAADTRHVTEILVAMAVAGSLRAFL